MTHVLGLDLSKVGLGQALEAMAEAWLDAQGVDDLTAVKPEYEIEYEGKIYYRWSQWRERKGINRQTFIALAAAAFGVDWEARIPQTTPYGSQILTGVITVEQAETLERLCNRSKSGESLQQLRKELQAGAAMVETERCLAPDGIDWRRVSDWVKTAPIGKTAAYKLMAGLGIKSRKVMLPEISAAVACLDPDQIAALDTAAARVANGESVTTVCRYNPPRQGAAAT